MHNYHWDRGWRRKARSPVLSLYQHLPYFSNMEGSCETADAQGYGSLHRVIKAFTGYLLYVTSKLVAKKAIKCFVKPCILSLFLNSLNKFTKP